MISPDQARDILVIIIQCERLRSSVSSRSGDHVNYAPEYPCELVLDLIVETMELYAGVATGPAMVKVAFAGRLRCGKVESSALP
jgi:hypothetical protein